MANRNTPYGAFNYIVEFDGGEILGGFSDISGIGSEIKVAGIHTAGDITGKRGIINSKTLFDWIKAARTNGPDAQKTMKITLLDEAQQPVQAWVLRGVIPMKYTGPTLAGKGGGDVAMEEVVFSAEAFEIAA